MNVAYVISSNNSKQILEDMIVPQLESNSHGANVLGMFFVFDNTYLLLESTDLAKKLEALHQKTGMIILACDQCVYKRNIEDKILKSASIGCFPILYASLESANLDQVITL